MARVIQKQPSKTPLPPLVPPNAATKVFSQAAIPIIPSPSTTGLLKGSVSPPTQPNFSIPPEWLGAFRG